MAESRKSSDNRKSAESRKYPGQLVYGLDIGTRSITYTIDWDLTTSSGSRLRTGVSISTVCSSAAMAVNRCRKPKS